MTVEQKAAEAEAAATRMRCLELAIAMCHNQAPYPVVLGVAEHFARYVFWGTVPPLPGAPS